MFVPLSLQTFSFFLFCGSNQISRVIGGCKLIAKEGLATIESYKTDKINKIPPFLVDFDI